MTLLLDGVVKNPINVLSVNISIVLILDESALEAMRLETAEENIPHYFGILH